jgi:MoaA/NifB/PqqE/SkfB family radical SAM enzyme
MRPGTLRLLVMHVSRRCDQTCSHCSIWQGAARGRGELQLPERLDIIRQARSLGARSVLFTGGEPLLCDHIERLARSARDLGLTVQIAANGLGLGRASSWLAEAVDEVYVSLEGPERIHDAVRGGGMFKRLGDGLALLVSRRPRPRLIGRCVIAAGNAGSIEATVGAARGLGLDALSFLAVDMTSGAFGGEPESRRALRPSAADVAEMLEDIGRLSAAGDLESFVLEDERKLGMMARDLLLEPAVRTAPRCNAPEWSSVVEADGGIRPCFFQPAVVASPNAGIGAVRGSSTYKSVLRRLGAGNPICASCVCPKHVPAGMEALTARIAAVLRRARPEKAHAAGSAA